MRRIVVNRSSALPEQYAITPALPPTYLTDKSHLLDDFLDNLKRLCDAGPSLILLRAPTLSRANYLSLARRAIAIARGAGSRLMLHNQPQFVTALRAAGAHLSHYCARRFTFRPVSDRAWFAVSCHSLAEVRRAERLGADFCVLGPVYATPTHLTRQPLGVKRFAAIVAAANIPVYALGGVQQEHAESLRRKGAQGIAGIRCFWPQAHKIKRS